MRSRSLPHLSTRAIHFDQVQVGDMINVTLTEERVVFVDKSGAVTQDGAAAMVALAPKGARPGGIVVEAVQITATIRDLNTTNRIVIL